MKNVGYAMRTKGCKRAKAYWQMVITMIKGMSQVQINAES